MTRFFIYLFVCHLGGTSFAQLLPIKTFSTEDGLSYPQVTAVLRDDRGILWVGTPFGLNWFDGTHFFQPPIQGKTGQIHIISFFKDARGDVWVLSFYNGIYRYHDGVFHQFLPSADRGSNSNTVLSMLEYAKGNYLVATDNGAFWFDGVSFQPFVSQDAIPSVQFHSVVKLSDGSIVFAGDSSIYRYSNTNGTWQHTGSFSQNSLVRKLFTHSNEVWMAASKGLYFFKNTEDFVAQKPTEVLLPGHDVINMSKGKDGALWIAADKIYKLKDGEQVLYDVSHGLSRSLSNVYHDQEGVTWFSSATGLSKLTQEYYKFYSLLNSPVHAMTIGLQADETGALWLGSYGGLAKKTGKGYELHSRIKGQDIGYVSALHRTRKGSLLAASDAGLLEITKQILRKKLHIRASRLFEDEHGALWIGSSNGKLYRLKNDSLQAVALNVETADYIDAIYKDRFDFLWIGYRGSGIFKFRLEGITGRLVKQFNGSTGFTDMRIRCSAPDGQGNIMFGTRTNGLFVFSLSDDKKYWHINSSKQLADNWVKFIAPDGQQNIYLATNKGVNVVSGFDYAFPTIRTLDLANGNIEKTANVILPMGDTVWIGTDEGIIQYFPKQETSDTTAPGVYFTQLAINSQPDSNFHPYEICNRSLRLPYDSSVISFGFAGVDMHGESLRYRYLLEGQDEAWSRPTDRSFVTYHLSPGKYRFKVLAVNERGINSLSPAVIDFVILAPFWKQAWFLTACLLAVFFLAYAVYRYRLKQWLQVERLRSRISSDLHDEIGSTLSSISILSELAMQETNKPQSKGILSEIKNSSVLLMEKMDDIIWSVNPKNDSLENLMLRIQAFASQLFEAKNIGYTIDIDPSICNLRLSMEYRQHVYLLLREAINNIVKYACCTTASIHIKVESGFLFISIQDNGRGFISDDIKRGNGLHNMKERAALLQATLVIESLPDAGTTISFRSKIK